jgi:anti-sigma-K factor RskA
MTCGEIAGRLDDYVDGALPESEAAEVERHLHACSACALEERGLRRLLAEARALPREAAPSRDLWSGIAERILVEHRPRVPWRTGGRAPLWSAAAAAVLLAAVLFLARGTGPAPAPLPTAVPAGFDPAGVQAAEREYERAAASLLATLHERRDSLSPETVASIDKNMEVIDRALAEVRAALDRDPKSMELTRLLVSTHRKKVDTLRRVVRLSL